jgi:PAS domain S-box-containing protein
LLVAATIVGLTTGWAGIADARLPRGSRVPYRLPDGWNLYRGYIVGGGVLVGLQSALIAGLLLQAKHRKRVELALRESEERFHLAADTAPVLIWMAGTDQLCDFFNRPWLEFTGRTLEEELGNGWAQGVFLDDLDRCLRTYVSAFDARQPFEMEYRLRRADGAYRWILDHGVPRFGSDGTFAGFIGSCVDITERKRSAEQFRFAIEAAPAGMFMVDRAGRIVMVNAQVERLFGYGREELLNKDVEMLVPERFRGHHVGLRGGFHQDPSARLAGAARDVCGLRKDGTEVAIEIGLNPLRTPDGDFVLGSVVEITERKRAESEREYLISQLRHLAGQMIATQDSERARIARDLHDDTSQRLAGLSIALSSVKRRVGALMDDDHLTEEVAALQQRTVAVAANIRNLSHDLHPSVLHYSGLVAALSAHCAELQLQQATRLTLQCTGDFESLDPEAALCLYRVAQEALRNVVRHAEARHADVQLLRNGGNAEILIADDGKGFDSVKVRTSGEGMGLLSIRERTRLAEGTVSIVTELGKGTQVRVRIPANRPANT